MASKARRVKKDSEVIAEAMELMGPNGEHWTQKKLKNNNGSYCMLGALSKAKYGRCHYGIENESVSKIVANSLPLQGDYNIPYFNDGAERTFKEVKKVMCKALNMALKQEVENAKEDAEA